MSFWLQHAEHVLAGIKFIPHQKMSELTTFKIGGPADLYTEPMNLEELSRILKFCAEYGVPWMVIGLGSNLLVRDKGIRGVVIKLGGEFLEWQIEGTTVTAGAGMALSDLAHYTAAEGLSGLEFACGIPGTVGGAAYMNAGAYEGEIAQVLTGVQSFDINHGVRWYGKEKLDFGYRRSRFQTVKEVILKITFNLTYLERDATLAKIADLTCKRESKQPLEMPSAGSVFRRPEGYYVGPLIEAAGLKGYAIGGAQVSLKHAGFIVNTGGATAQDVLDLIGHIQKTVRERNGVELIPEIKVVGEE